MQALFKTLLILLICIPLAICVGYTIGDEEYYFVAALGGFILLGGAYKIFASEIRIEAFLITVLIAVYYIGGKAASILSLGGPFFIGEVTLAFAAVSLILRYALTGETLERTSLSIPLMVMLAYGAVHLCIDYPKYGLISIRDSATVYYILFFFFGLSISNHPPSIEFLKKWVINAIVFTCIFIHPYTLFVDEKGMIFAGDTPLIAHTSDTIGVSYLTACAFFYLKARHGGATRILCYTLSAVCLALSAATGRSTYTLAVITLMIYLWKIGARGFAIGSVVAVVVAVMLSSVAIQSGMLSDDSGRFGYVAGHLAALASPVTGTESRAGDSVAKETIAWRLGWWEYIATTTGKEAPFMGLGFGHDISTGFLEEFYDVSGLTEDSQGARSPHSVLFTFLGRTGIIGAAIFLWIVWACIKQAWEAAGRERDVRELSLWCLLVSIGVSGFFAVVLEGPNGAIPFWAIFGVLTGKITKEVVASSRVKGLLARGVERVKIASERRQPAYS